MKRLTRVFELDVVTGDFGNPLFTTMVNADKILVSPDLDTDTDYKWRCKDILESGVESNWSAVQYFTTVTQEMTGELEFSFANYNATGTTDYDNYGYNVAMNSDISVVSSHLEDLGGLSNSGTVYVYDNDSGNMEFMLVNPDASAGASFGQAIAVCESYIIVGSQNTDRAYIYNTSGSLLHTLVNPNINTDNAHDLFGYSVDICEEYAIVGARSEDFGSSGSGTSYIYSTSTGAVTLTLQSPSGQSSGYFGNKVAISSSYAAVTAYAVNDGTVYIFDSTATGTTSTALHTLHIGNDLFGSSLALSDDKLVVGDHGFISYTGIAYVYDVLDFTSSTMLGSGVATGATFGYAVDICDSYIIVGAYNGGHAYIYNTSDLSLAFTLTNPDPDGNPSGDNFGFGVGISNFKSLVSSQGEDLDGYSFGGYAFIFK